MSLASSPHDRPARSEARAASKPDDPGGLPLAVALTFLAGLVDAAAYVHWHGLFVSFMSGNSTALGTQLARVESGPALLSAVVVGGFVVGVTAGELLAISLGRRVAEVVLLLEGVLLAVGARCLHARLPELALAPALSFAMGMQNAAVHRGGGLSVSLTYVTGTLVHVGRSLAGAIRARATWFEVVPYLTLWFGLILGAVIGAFVATRSETLALALAAGWALVLSLLVALVPAKPTAT